MTKKSKTVKFKTVNKKFLKDLANKIYNEKTGKYLRLCRGTLQNGPDPKNKKRTMHCGLGELFYEMAGKQPKAADVLMLDSRDGEDVVCELAFLNSTIKDKPDRDDIETIIGLLRKYGNYYDYEVSRPLEEVLDSITEPIRESAFFRTLMEIPEINDTNKHIISEDGFTQRTEEEIYKVRSKAVADKLREAAELLPR